MSWGYGTGDGPSSWCKSFPCANGERQSPIDISTAQAEFESSFQSNPLKISYVTEKGMELSNTGASMKADTTQDNTLTGGPLGNKVYKLIQFHLHWGGEDSRGAEHTIDGKVYSAELHLVHWNTAYGTFGEAVDKPDGLAVLCMFIEVSNNKAHDGFNLVSCQLNNIVKKGDCCKLSTDFNPSCLLPNDTQKYWTYPGSLTTPPCYESVQFILFKEPITFSTEQMNALRSLKFGDGSSPCMMDNYRPTCPLGSRKVQASFVN